jgi:hypothetical protein
MPVITRRRGRHPLLRDRRAQAGGVAVAVVLLLGGTAVFAGTRGLAGAAVGLALVTAFFLGGRLPVCLGAWANPAVGFAVLGLGYAVRVVLVILALRALRDDGWIDQRTLGAAVVLGALMWSVGQVVAHVTSRRPTIEPMGSRR